MPRRGENIYHRKDGRWEARVPVGYTETGKKKYRSLYARTYSEAKQKMKEQKPLPPLNVADKPLGDMRMEEAIQKWMEDNRLHWKESTYSCYMQIASKQLIPAFGKMKVKEVSSRVLNQFVEEKRRDDVPLSDSYLKDMMRILIQSLKHLRDGYGYDVAIPLANLKIRERSEKKLPDQETMKKVGKISPGSSG
ncbi:MAG: hypothetical protein GX234_08475 [Clostridiales bacterium]|nr:hypothetical protein [Clostridiales bacterium]